jgi:hypothetical protein
MTSKKWNNTTNLLEDFSQMKVFYKDNKVDINIDDSHCIDEIQSIYDDVLIDNRDINNVIDKERKDSFYNAGGIFNNPSRDELKKFIKDDSCSIITLGLEDKIVGMLSIRTDTSELDDLCYKKDVEDVDDFVEALKQDKVFNPVDIIMVQNYSGMVFQLLYNVLKPFASIGYTYWAVDIYTILSHEKDGKHMELNHRNNGSATFVEKIHGRKIGDLGIHNFVYGDDIIKTERNIYAVPMKQSLEEMESIINKKARVHYEK